MGVWSARPGSKVGVEGGLRFGVVVLQKSRLHRVVDY